MIQIATGPSSTMSPTDHYSSKIACLTQYKAELNPGSALFQASTSIWRLAFCLLKECTVQYKCTTTIDQRSVDSCIFCILGMQADVFLAPQIFAAIERTKIDMVSSFYLLYKCKSLYNFSVEEVMKHADVPLLQSNYPTIARLHAEYMAHPAFQAALPGRQPDVPSSS